MGMTVMEGATAMATTMAIEGAMTMQHQRQ
jgi:hypothetical protein